MLGESFMTLTRRASMEGLQTPVTDTKKKALRRSRVSPLCLRRHSMACSPSCRAVSIQTLLVLPHVSSASYSPSGREK